MEPNLPLRDIHLPAPIALWPPAPGWWLLLFGIPTLLFMLAWLWRWLRRKTVRKLALAELESIADSKADAREKVQELAILLRRVALSVYPREQVAGLAGEPWLAFLDGLLGNDSFSAGAGRLFIEAPYRREVHADLDALFALCREWIKRLPKPGQASAKPSQQKRSKPL
jgi:hypothetical protein